MTRTTALILLAALAAAACTEPNHSSRTDEQSGALTAPGSEQPGPEQPAPGPDAPKDPVPTTIIEDIDWDEADRYRQIDRDRLSDKQRAAIDRVPLPVLLPDDDAMLAKATIVPGKEWYSVSMALDGHGVVVHGTRKAHHVPGVSDAVKDIPLASDDHVLTRTDGIVSLSFRAFGGAAYSIDVECTKPFQDKRCTEDAYVIDVAEKLGVAGGAR